ncbi:MAG: enolase C-terminal domain-like protein [Planctomycetaceae bacterium]
MEKAKSTDIRILDVDVRFEPVSFRAPLKFGGRIVDQTYLINACVTVETRNGNQARGFGSMPVGNVWAWPSAAVDPAGSEAAMKAYAERFAELFGSYPEFAHPMEIQFQVGAEFHHQARKVADKLSLPEPLPELAQLVATSPIDAALHDAYGRVHKANSFNLLSAEYCNEDLSYYLDDQFADEYMDQYTLREPVARLPLYHLVGALDPLTDADVTDRPDDRLPVTLGEWIAANGLTHLKIKLAGDNLNWDVARVLAVEKATQEAQAARGCREWFYSCDFNEKCDSAEYVIEFLKQVQSQAAAAYDRIQYIEQPTSRDLEAASAAKMHDVAKLKPVVIDEALVDYEALLKCRELGYSGVALKACKGQTESLLAAAAAQKFGMFLCVQDLTCPGASFLQSCSLAARIPGVAAIEGNARQYCPEPNKKWAKRYPEMFTITDGTVGTGKLSETGLGYHLPEWTTTAKLKDMEDAAAIAATTERIVRKTERNES